MKILEIGQDYIIYLNDKGKVRMKGFSKYQVIRNKDKIIFLDKSNIEIRKEILEYKLNGNYRVKVHSDYVQIDKDFRVMLSDGESRYKPISNYVYLCVQPKETVRDIEVNTPLGIMCLDRIGALCYAKVLFLLDIKDYGKSDYYIKQQFRENRYRKYLE